MIYLACLAPAPWSTIPKILSNLKYFVNIKHFLWFFFSPLFSQVLLLEKFVLILNEVKSRRAIKKLDCTFGSLLLYFCLTLTNKNVQKITCFMLLMNNMTCSITYLLLMEMPLPLLEHPGLMIHKFRRPSISICAGHAFLSFSKVFLAWKTSLKWLTVAMPY